MLFEQCLVYLSVNTNVCPSTMIHELDDSDNVYVQEADVVSPRVAPDSATRICNNVNHETAL